MKLMTAMKLAKRKSHTYYLQHTSFAEFGANIVSSRTAKTLLPIGSPPMLPLSHRSALGLATFPNVVKITWVKALATTSLVRTAA